MVGEKVVEFVTSLCDLFADLITIIVLQQKLELLVMSSSRRHYSHEQVTDVLYANYEGGSVVGSSLDDPNEETGGKMSGKAEKVEKSVRAEEVLSLPFLSSPHE